MKAVLITLDSLGIGGARDAADFGDSGSDTLRAVSRESGFRIPNLLNLGLGNIDNIDYLPAVSSPVGAYARLTEKGKNKDTLAGHWELTGVVAEPFRTYPDGFPATLIERFERDTGYKALVNKAYSGTEVVSEYGARQMKGKNVIVYTSADSVLQIAAHTDVVPLSELYDICKVARRIADDYGIARVIARPFQGAPDSFYRTSDRRDFSMPPPSPTVLDELKGLGLDVIGVGKINDIFAGRGITETYHTDSNADGIKRTIELMKRGFNGLLFVNLVDFDMLYGHRNDAEGYARALSEFDAALPDVLSLISPSDALILTADHGCDPSTPSTDHSREDVPALFYGAPYARGLNLGTITGFDFVAKTLREFFAAVSAAKNVK